MPDVLSQRAASLLEIDDVVELGEAAAVALRYLCPNVHERFAMLLGAVILDLGCLGRSDTVAWLDETSVKALRVLRDPTREAGIAVIGAGLRLEIDRQGVRAPLRVAALWLVA